MDYLGDWKEISKSIRFENKNIKSRLQSILHDYQYIQEVVEPTFPDYKVIPNERCGLWYYPPESYSKTCYFKSTDGHTGIWEFSHRRLNFHLLEDIFRDNGIVIVDSTRRGKKLPDALSKTIPIWCGVINTIINGDVGALPRNTEPDRAKYLYFPPKTVSKTEQKQIEEKLPRLVENCLKYIPNAREIIISKMGKGLQEIVENNTGREIVLRPIWIYPGSRNSVDPFTGNIVPWSSTVTHDEAANGPVFLDICCCCCSYQCQDGVDKKSGYTYVQGAADDHELWSQGLEPLKFWEHVDFFSDLSRTDGDIVRYIETITMQENSSDGDKAIEIEKVADQLYIGKSSSHTDCCSGMGFDLWIRCGNPDFPSEEATKVDKPRTRIVNFPSLKSNEKKSGKNLRISLIEIVPLIQSYVLETPGSTAVQKRVLVTCDTGTDISAGIALAIVSNNSGKSITKVNIRQNLTSIINSVEKFQINPTRATLNSVNSYLM